MNQTLIDAITRLNQLMENASLQNTYAAAQVLLSIVPIVGIVVGGFILFYFLLWRYKIQMELITKDKYITYNGKNLRILCLLLGSRVQLLVYR